MVVFIAPETDFFPGISQVAEPAGVKAFIPEAAVEAFYMAVLHGLSRLNVY